MDCGQLNLRGFPVLINFLLTAYLNTAGKCIMIFRHSPQFNSKKFDAFQSVIQKVKIFNIPSSYLIELASTAGSIITFVIIFW